MTLSMGPHESGIPWHIHKAGWNEVLYGMKMWYVYSVEEGTPPGGYTLAAPPAAWVQQQHAGLSAAARPQECLQVPGSVVFVPEGAFHTVLNIGETVAVAQRSVEQLRFGRVEPAPKSRLARGGAPA